MSAVIRFLIATVTRFLVLGALVLRWPCFIASFACLVAAYFAPTNSPDLFILGGFGVVAVVVFLCSFLPPAKRGRTVRTIAPPHPEATTGLDRLQRDGYDTWKASK